MGQEPDDPAGSLPRRPRRPRAADPGGADAPDLRGVRAPQGAMGRLDFEDMLGLALRLFDEHPDAAEAVRSRFPAFTVDEFQDVNPLQAGLLERWLGERDDLCVVGDDYQTIYAFTGASPEYLLGFTRAVPARDGGSPRGELPLHAGDPRGREPAGAPPRRVPQDPPGDHALGPPPVARAVRDEAAEVAVVVEAVRRLHREESRAARGDRGAVPDQRPVGAVRGGLRRRGHPVPGPRRGVPPATRSARGPPTAEADERRRARPRPSWASPTSSATTQRRRPTPTRRSRASPTSRGCARSRRSSRARIPAAISRRSSPSSTRRFSTEHSGRGVNLLTYHRAKGLEFDAVFLPRLVDGELPFRSGRARPTRERSDDCSTWYHAGPPVPVPHLARRRSPRPSPFLDELELSTPEAGREGHRLRARPSPWARRRAVRPAEGMAPKAGEADGVPAYVVFHDRTLAEIAERVQGLGRSRGDLGCRPREARAVRGRDPGDRRGEVAQVGRISDRRLSFWCSDRSFPLRVLREHLGIRPQDRATVAGPSPRRHRGSRSRSSGSRSSSTSRFGSCSDGASPRRCNPTARLLELRPLDELVELHHRPLAGEHADEVRDQSGIDVSEARVDRGACRGGIVAGSAVHGPDLRPPRRRHRGQLVSGRRISTADAKQVDTTSAWSSEDRSRG